MTVSEALSEEECGYSSTKRAGDRLFLQQRSTPNAMGCWIWDGALAGKGYPHFRRDGKDEYGHRLALKVKIGRWPLPGLVSDHFYCDTPACVNPEHVKESTYKDNILRGRAGERRLVCWRGHRLDRVTPKGKHYCSLCMTINNAKKKKVSVGAGK